MIRTWQTIAVVTAVWAPQGEIDGGSIALVLLSGLSLFMVWGAERKQEQKAATPTSTLT